MAHCTQCGYSIAANDRFCGKCGAPLHGSQTTRQRYGEERRRRPEFVAALKTEEGQRAFQELQARKAASSRTALWAALALAAVMAGGGFLFSKPDTAAVIGIVSAVLAVVGTMCALSLRSWSEADYYSIPGSRDSTGEHRCIHCGHRGIYRHGQYKSNTKYADCSKCKANLWTE